MNAPTIMNGTSISKLLKSLGFINITGVQIMAGPKVNRTVGFSGHKFRCRWSRRSCYVAIVDSNGDVFLRYGTDDITQGNVFKEIVTNLNCVEDNDEMIISSCTPSSGQQFDTEQLLDRIFFQKVLT